MGHVSTAEPAVADLLRELAPRILGVLVRRNGNFDDCEDAVQEALLAAAVSWPVDGIPTNPTGWLITTASRRLVESWRKESARRRREEAYALERVSPPGSASAVDETLALVFLCCHPVLSVPSQVALTLRALGGLTTAEVARALLLPEATVGQRISRAKARIRDTGAQFRMPTARERDERLPAVLHALYLIFNEGYTATSGEVLSRVELTSEAIRLTRQLRESLPAEGEVAGLLALMLLTDARRSARTGPDGALIPLAEQDRRRWDRAAIAEGIAIIEATLPIAKPGPYQLQAAIAAVHDEAADVHATDWPQILALYDVLTAIAPGPMVALNRTVAVAMVHGPAAALAELNDAAADPAISGHHRVDAVRAHLLDELGDRDAAREHYLRAAQRTRSLPEQRYLLARATRSPAASSGGGSNPPTAPAPGS
jgi:RNA polymerase sigma factor (sigma-70 family)